MPDATRHPALIARCSSLEGAAVLLAVAGLPLVFAPMDYAPFLHVKPAWGQTAAVAILCAWAWRALSGQTVRLALHAPNVLAGLFILWNLALCPFASSPSLAWERCVWLASAWAIALGWQEWTRLGGRRRLLALAWALAASAGLTSAWVLWQDLSAKSMLPAWVPLPICTANLLGDWRGYVTAGFGNTDFVAAFLATLYLPLLFLFLRGRRLGRRAGILAAILWAMTAALIVCWSVGGNGALIVGALVVAWVAGRRFRRSLRRGRTRRRLIAWATGCALVVLWLVTDTPLNPHRPGIFQEAFDSPRWKEGGPTRWVIWLNAFEMVRRHQLAGVGPGCFTFVYPATLSPFVPADREWQQYQGMYTNAAHNSLLQAWAETGPLGAALLAAAVVAAFASLRRAGRARTPSVRWAAWAGIGALTVWCLDAQMTFPLELPPLVVLFFVLLGLGPALADMAGGRRGGFAMPPFVLQGRWTELTLELQGMRRVRALGLACDVGKGVARVLGGVALLAALLAAAQVWRPVVADAKYARAHAARENLTVARDDADRKRIADRADGLYALALRIWPRHHDCRSEYSQFLVDVGRPAEALAQLAIVRLRLNSNELYLREADAYLDLGRKDEAAERLLHLFGRGSASDLFRNAAQAHRALGQPARAARYDAVAK